MFNRFKALGECMCRVLSDRENGRCIDVAISFVVMSIVTRTGLFMTRCFDWLSFV